MQIVFTPQYNECQWNFVCGLTVLKNSIYENHQQCVVPDTYVPGVSNSITEGTILSRGEASPFLQR